MTFDPGRFTYDVRQLVDAGMKTGANEVFTYRDMSTRLQRQVTGGDGAVQEAVKRLSRDHGIEFKNVRNVGYVRLDDVGIVDHASTDRLQIHRKIGKAARRSANIRDWEALSDQYKREADTHRSIINLMRSILRPASVRRVRNEVDRARNELDVDKTLMLFRKEKSQS